MSSVVSAPGAAGPRPRRTAPLTGLPRLGSHGDFRLGLAAALVLTLVAFAGSGGIDLGPNTWVQAGLVVLAAAAASAVLLSGAPGPRWGAGAAAAFTLLAALTYASIAWSVQPADSWLEANRTLSYLAAFATTLLLARIAPARWPALVGGLAAAATAVCGYALLVKVFPDTLDPGDPLGRLRAPFDYWNAVGLMAALGLPAAVWAGARREAGRFTRALSVPAIAILVPALVLAYSRGALIAAVVGLGVWFALAPVRLRSVLMLALGVAGGAAISVWGLSTRGISADGVPIGARTSAGHGFGLVVMAVLILSTVAGLAATFGLDRFSLSPRLRRRIGTALVAGVALVPVGGIAALAASSRGLTGEVSHEWKALTNPNGVIGDQPGRLVQLSNSRPHYWSQALKIGEHHLAGGSGALGFATAQTAYPAGRVWDPLHAHVVHAHGYLLETFADLGLVGVAVSLAVLVAWALAAARTLGFRRSGQPLEPPRGPPTGNGSVSAAAPAQRAAERNGLVALLATVVIFGLHSLIDWTWFIPGTAVAALACAGWLAGRGEPGAAIGRLASRRRLSRSPGTAGLIALTGVLTLLALWVIVQPLRSSDDYSAAISAALHGRTQSAIDDARSASVENPVSIEPLFLLSQLYSGLGDRPAARRELTQAAVRQPDNPRSWQQLGCFDLVRHSPSAGRELRRLLALEPSQTQAKSDPTAFCAGAG